MSVATCGWSTCCTPWRAVTVSTSSTTSIMWSHWASESSGRGPLVGVVDDRRHEVPAPIGLEQARHLLGRRHRCVSTSWVVGDDRHERADCTQVVRVERRSQRPGLGREPADGTELGGRQADVRASPRAPGRPGAAYPSPAPRRPPTRSGRPRPGPSEPDAAPRRCTPRSPSVAAVGTGPSGWSAHARTSAAGLSRSDAGASVVQTLVHATRFVLVDELASRIVIGDLGADDLPPHAGPGDRVVLVGVTTITAGPGSSRAACNAARTSRRSWRTRPGRRRSRRSSRSRSR